MPDPILASAPADCCLNCSPRDASRQMNSNCGYRNLMPERNTNQIFLCSPKAVWGIDVFVNGQLLVDYFTSQGQQVQQLTVQ